jgi:hypothetical protein
VKTFNERKNPKRSWVRPIGVSLLVLSLLAVSACEEAPSKTLEPIQPALALGSVSSEFTATVEVLPGINQYQVRLTWKMHDKPNRWSIEKYENDLHLKRVSVEGTLTNYVDKDVKPGSKYTYYLLSPVDEAMGLKAETTVPKDLSVENDVVFTNAKIIEVNRLLLRKGAKLITNGFPLTIFANEITISDTALVNTSVPGTKATPNGVGKPAGSIRIFSKRAKGHLTISGNGQDGGDGSDGANGKNGSQGAQGTPGSIEIRPNDQLALQKNGEERAKLKEFYSRLTWNDPTLGGGERAREAWNRWWYCTQQTGDGQKGAAGEDGKDGGNGGTGGDSANVFIQVAEDSDFKVDVDAIPGKGGVGGRGGILGVGGPGGLPGTQDQGHVCRDATAGPEGDDGRNGRTGKYGDVGKKNSICVKIGSSENGNCQEENR